MTPVPTITLYGRPGCHLCDDARAVLARVGIEHAFILQEVDIDSDDRLLKAYLERIPVLVLDEEELSEFFIDEADLRGRLPTRPTY